jgi:hypothetical protein
VGAVSERTRGDDVGVGLARAIRIERVVGVVVERSFRGW